MSLRKGATSVLITTQCSHPTRSPNRPRKLTKKKTHVLPDDDIITVVELKSTEIDKEKTYVLPDGNIITVAPNIGFVTERGREGDCSGRQREAELHWLRLRHGAQIGRGI